MSKAKTPYNKAQGYAISGCWESIFKPQTNNLLADKEHQETVTIDNTIPRIPLFINYFNT